MDRIQSISCLSLGQRCRGRNYDGKRCCTPDNPCEEGEGDCDGPGDGGLNDGHAGCKGDLVCGSNNCLKFGAYYHEKDDCCEKSTSPLTAPKSPEFRREEQKGEFRELTRSTKSICHENPLKPPPTTTHLNCFSASLHPSPPPPNSSPTPSSPPTPLAPRPCHNCNFNWFFVYFPILMTTTGWGPWSSWGPCSHTCGAGRKSRSRQCLGKCKDHHLFETQERICINPECNFL